MNIDVLKNNEILASFDLSDEVTGDLAQEFKTLIGRGTNCYIKIEDRMFSREQGAVVFSGGNGRLKISQHPDQLLMRMEKK